jgi:hypothetical protein
MIPTNIVRTAQNLSAKVVGSSASSRVSVVLTWHNPPAMQSWVEFDGLRARLDELAIIRSTDEEILKARSWTDIFGLTQPPILKKDQVVLNDCLTSTNNKSKVIRVFKYDGVRNSYVDDDPNLKTGVDYFYAISYQYSFADSPPEDQKPVYIEQLYEQFSNIAVLRIQDNIPTVIGGPKPDWQSHRSPLDMIPSLKTLMTRALGYVDSFKTRTKGLNDTLKSYIDFLVTEASRYQDFAEDIQRKVNKLVQILQIPAVGIYVTEIASNKGGIDYFIQELIQRLSDESDETAPPFHKTGITAGAIMLVGAPNPAEFAATKRLLQFFFGANPIKTAIETAIDDIDRLLNDVETRLFSKDMKPGTAPIQEPPYNTFKPDMTPVSADDADADVPFDP